MDKFEPSALPSFSDDQLTQIFRAAAPLTPSERVAFLEDLGRELQANHRGSVGDGQLFRLIRETQRRHFDPPAFDRIVRPASRWQR
jgi:hypothetical protein